MLETIPQDMGTTRIQQNMIKYSILTKGIMLEFSENLFWYTSISIYMMTVLYILFLRKTVFDLWFVQFMHYLMDISSTEGLYKSFDWVLYFGDVELFIPFCNYFLKFEGKMDLPQHLNYPQFYKISTHIHSQPVYFFFIQKLVQSKESLILRPDIVLVQMHISNIDTHKDVDRDQNGHFEWIYFQEFLIFFGDEIVNDIDNLDKKFTGYFFPRIYQHFMINVSVFKLSTYTAKIFMP